MINLTADNLIKIDPAHGLTKVELEATPAQIADSLAKIHQRNQGFYQVIDDQPTIDKINDYAKTNKNKFDHIVVCGIGGSALGTICLQNSLTHLYKKTKPNLHVLDNIDPDMIKELEDTIDYSKTLFIIISKSGGTPETKAQYHYFKNKAPKENFLIITGENGYLRDEATEQNIKTFNVPENVGGRFSVLTAVGLLPAALIGLDINMLIKGAKQMRDKFLSENPEENICHKIALIQYHLYKKNKSIAVMYPYSQKLRTFADWYAQLLGESIGKSPEIGITPVSALGVTDQHSQNQLYMDGPNDKLYIFIEVEKFQNEIDIKSQDDELKGVTFNRLLNTEKRATEDALTQNQKPNITIKVPAVNEEALGQLFMLFEGSIAFLGEMFKINAFDQPGVELSKQLTKKYLNA